MKKFVILFLVGVICLEVGLIFGKKISQSAITQTVKPTASFNNLRWGQEVNLESPTGTEPVTSPITVKGKIKRSWTFEAVMTAWVTDEEKKVIGGGPVYTTWENETDEWVAFNTTISFTPKGRGGYFQIKNDNPSNLVENEKVFEIPIIFKSR